MMKIVSINYQPIVNGRCGNMLIQKIYDCFLSLPISNTLFLSSSIDKHYRDNIKGLDWSCYFIIRVFRRYCKLLKKPYYYQRTVEEHIVDKYMAKYLSKVSEPYTLLTSMYSPISCELTKRKGNKVILIAGNLNDNLYFQVVKKEKKRLGLTYIDVYDSEFRLDYYNKTLNYVDEVWCNTKLCVSSFSKTHKTRYVPTSFYTFNNSIIKNQIRTEYKPIVIGYIGHTVLLKGVHQFAEAISISKYKEDIILEIAGSIAPEIKDIINKYKINVKYIGRISEEEKKLFMLRIDALVVPSLFDGGPTTIYEGLESGVPLIVSDGCGRAEFLLDKINSLIFKSSDIDDMRKKIDYFCENVKSITESSIKSNKSAINSIIERNPEDAFDKALNSLLS